uniref:Chemokine interleukin-8-like domain-containing protein n=1 Tax=Cavia porcellus TaxID=10141 RepID=H0V9E2_CAVPO|nr:C-C motif chemokine 25 [Cavia porcellus]
MNPWLLACLVAFFVGGWVPAMHTQGVSEDCCLAYHPPLRLSVFLHARYFRWQEVSGSCNLPAVIFHFPQPGRVVCGNPRDKVVRKAMRVLRTQMKSQQQASNVTVQGLQARRNKENSSLSKMHSIRLRHHLGNGKKNAGAVVTSK